MTTRRTRPLPFAALALVAALVAALATASATPLGAQEAPPPLPPPSPPPPASQASPPPAVPPANAVALCNDGTFVVAPALPSACGARGGLKLTLPGPRPAPPAPPARQVDARAEPTTRSDVPPPGATMRCKDGTWLTGTPAVSRCAANGGLAVILPPPAPARPPSP